MSEADQIISQDDLNELFGKLDSACRNGIPFSEITTSQIGIGEIKKADLEEEILSTFLLSFDMTPENQANCFLDYYHCISEKIKSRFSDEITLDDLAKRATKLRIKAETEIARQNPIGNFDDLKSVTDLRHLQTMETIVTKAAEIERQENLQE